MVSRKDVRWGWKDWGVALFAQIGSWFSTPQRQALGWAGLGVAGMVMAAVGLLLIMGGGEGGTTLATDEDSTSTPTETASPTATRTPGAPGATLSATPEDEPTETPEPTQAVTTGGGGSGGGGGGGAPQAPAATATPVPPTATPTEAAPSLAYCGPNVSGGNSLPSLSRVAGAVTQGSEPAANVTVTLLIGGVVAGSTTTNDEGHFGMNFGQSASPGCANSPGATIALSVLGHVVAVGAFTSHPGGYAAFVDLP